MVDFAAIRKAQRANGPATVMAIGTATPPNCVEQSSYADFYFRVTNSCHMTELKKKLEHICDRSTVKKRYTIITEDLLKENPNLCVYNAPSWNTRRSILVEEIPKLAEKAATKAIKEWGQPKSKITHLIFCNTGSADMPGPDLHLSKLLNLNPSVKRYMMYQQGCFGGGMVLRLAKDLAENNQGARVLIVSSEITLSAFTGPSSASLDNIVGQAIFGDGAAAVIVGADPIIGVEKPLFQIVSALQTIIPDTEDALNAYIKEEGLVFHVGKDIPGLVSDNLESCLKAALEPLGISNWNSLFWLVHPGGPAILNKIEEKLNLKNEKLCASRTVLSEYGNTESAAILFVLDEMRKKSAKEGFKTTGEGLDFGVLVVLGPGITIETVVLHSMPT